MDEQSGETEEEEVISEGIGVSGVEELVPEWGWRRDRGSWFQRHGEAYRKDRLVVLREDDVRGRARVSTYEERVLYEDIEQRILNGSRNLTMPFSGMIRTRYHQPTYQVWSL